MVAELESVEDWTPQQAALAVALAELARLCDLAAAASANDDEVLDIELAIRPALPTELQSLVTMAGRGGPAPGRSRAHRARRSGCTRDEFIAQAETTGELTEPEPDADGLGPWYPLFVERLAAMPLAGPAVDALTQGGTWAAFDFAGVPASRRPQTARALEGWLQLRKGPTRVGGSAWTALLDVLAPLGLRGEREHQVPGQGARDHQWRDLIGVRRTGAALVPQFGSASAGADGSRLRLLTCWSGPSPDTIAQWCEAEGGDANVLVLYPGLLAVEARRELAAGLRRSRRKQAIAVVDDAAFLWLCVAPEPAFEMFYGRRRELEEVLRPDGASFIFGGRQFGKPALLRHAERELGGGGDRRAVYVALGSPPYPVEERDVEAVIADRELLARFRERFRLTIDLDPRYKVVADVIAFEAAQR